jgi:subtilisin family serine protease
MRRLAVAGALAALLLPASAAGGRYAVGVQPGASVAEVAAAVERNTGTPVSADAALRAVFVSARGPRLAALPGVSYVERLDSPRRLAFVPNDPFFPRQWHLPQIRAFDVWPQFPALRIVRVAILDSGVDPKHPELSGRIAAAKSFIGGSPYHDRRGHGTFVAGEIAAETDNGMGIAGLALSADLVIAKVARVDGTIPLEAEARAIRWAVDKGARVINLSLAGVRDPVRPGRDTYSPLEASAVAYAHRHGALVVAAVGNSDQTPRSPWNYAGYPAALPHVVGVSALTKSGSVPPFSNRDAVYNDLAAPGEDILSTLPRALTGPRSSCQSPGYSECGPPEFRHAEGTSFSAPLVSAAAALVLATKPDLKPDQVATLIERSAADATPSTGCRACSLFRDRFTGWGRLDVTTAVMGALAGAFPRADRLEPNDGPGGAAYKLFGRRRGRVNAMIDFWDDRSDVYRVRLDAGQQVSARLRGPAGTDTNLMLWRPGTRQLGRLAAAGYRVAQSTRPGPVEQIPRYRARTTGWHLLEVRISKPGSGGYSLTYTKTP